MIPLATDFVQFATAKEGFRETPSPARSMYPDRKDLVARAVAAATARHAAALEKWKLVVKVDSHQVAQPLLAVQVFPAHSNYLHSQEWLCYQKTRNVVLRTQPASLAP